MPIATTWVQYVGDGVTQNFSIPFPYISKAHVKCVVSGVPRVQDSHFHVSGSTLTFKDAFIPVNGVTITIERETPLDSLVTYQPGSILTADDLNTGQQQNIYLIQEIVGKWNTLLDRGAIRLSDGTFSTIQDMIDAVSAEILASELFQILSTNIEDVDVLAADLLSTQITVNDQVVTIANLSSALDAVDTAVINETQARIDGDTALVDTLALIGAKSGDGLSFIVDLDKVKVGPTESLGQRFSLISSSINDNAADIYTEQQARISQDGVLASSITTLETDVGDNSAAIQTHASTLNGLTAQYFVKTDVNGRVAGFGLYSTSVATDFIILADRFAIVDPNNNATVKVPFSVSGGVAYLQNVVVGGALIDELGVNKLGPGTMDVDMNLGTTGKIRGGQTSYLNGTGFFLGYESGGYKFSIGSSTSYLAWTGSYVRMYNSRLRMDAGGYSRIIGAGFGTASQFTDWFGADPGLDSAAAEANAIWYIKTDGTAKFNGILGATAIASQSLTVSVSGGSFTGGVSNGQVAYGTRTAIASGGTGSYSYEWSITFQGEDRIPPTGDKFWITGGETTATVGVSGYATDNVLFGRLRVDVTDSEGRKGYATIGVNKTHGTPL